MFGSVCRLVWISNLYVCIKLPHTTYNGHFIVSKWPSFLPIWNGYTHVLKSEHQLEELCFSDLEINNILHNVGHFEAINLTMALSPVIIIILYINYSKLKLAISEVNW